VSETRKLAAILVADVVGYSRLVGADEERILARLRTLRSDLIDPIISVHHGRIVKRTGDGSIIEFRSVVDAVRCAIEVQNGMAIRNAGVPADERIAFRVGVHLGDVVEEADGDLMGDGVNIASRLEGLSEPGGICLSAAAYEQVRDRLKESFADLGEKSLKNIARPIRAYALSAAAIAASGATGASVGRGRRPRQPLSASAATALAAAVALALVAAGASAWHWGYAPRLLGASVAEDKLKTAPRLSIVVLPFENLSGDKEQDYFADAITDDLTTDLSNIEGSFVIARNTAFTYKGKQVDAKQIGRELGVRYVLEGSVRRVGETITVNAQLISTETGAHVWADRLEGERGKLGELQVEVVSRLASTLFDELVKAESKRAMRERSVNPDALDYAVRGWAIMESSGLNKSSWNEAVEMFERAHSLDPRSVDDMLGLATALTVRADNHWSEDSTGDLKRAEELINVAEALQPNNTWLHMTKGRIFSVRQEWRSALAEAETAIANYRSNARALGNAGYYKMRLGRSQEGVADIEAALRLDPHSNEAPTWQVHLCYLRAHLAQWDQAIEQCRKAVSVAPSDCCALGELAAAYAWAGHDTEAKEALAGLQKINPNFMRDYQTAKRSSDDPTHKTEIARIVEGLRKAEALEGEAKSN
jgi:TolB-like protein/class 3 adenylate cyclase/tetratricopeptide (TPR) repeat protein